MDIDKEIERVKTLMESRAINLSYFKYGKRVRFTFGKGTLEGAIVTFDRAGGGIYLFECPSVDIQCDDGIVYKHIAIVDVEKC